MNITAELKATVAAHAKFKEVHFAENGDYYFEAHNINGVKYGRTEIKYVKSDNPLNVGFNIKQVHVGVESTRIVETVTRARILNPEILDVVESAADKNKNKK